MGNLLIIQVYRRLVGLMKNSYQTFYINQYINRLLHISVCSFLLFEIFQDFLFSCQKSEKLQTQIPPWKNVLDTAFGFMNGYM